MKRLLSFMLCASVFFVFGCNPTPEPTPEPTPDPVLSVSPESLAFTAEGGAQTVQVKANNPWTASASGSGISVNPSSGDGDATVTITATATNSIDPITGTVSFRTGRLYATVSVTQEERKVIRVGDVMTIPAEGGSFAVDVQYNTDVVVEVESAAQSWITFVEVRALTSRKLEFLFSDNYFNTEQRTGKVTVKDKNGNVSPITLIFTQEEDKTMMEYRAILMEFYNAMDGPNWTKQQGWGTADNINDWEGVSYSHYPSHFSYTTCITLNFHGVGLKGEIPESISNLTTMEGFAISDEPGVTGSLPHSFANLTNLKLLQFKNTGLQSIPDVFSGMKSLITVLIYENSQLACPLPPSLGDSPKLERLYLKNNCFTGDLPASWASLGDKLNTSGNRLTGKMPQSFLDSEYRDYFFVYCFPQQTGYGLDVSDIEIHGWQYWIDGEVEDLDGNLFSFEDVVKKNKYTVYINWAPWCPFSKVLMPQLRDYYNIYRQDGLEVIATVMFDQNDALWKKPQEQKQEIMDKGYDGWYNFYYWGEGLEHRSYAMETPLAEVYDENGYIVFSGFQSYTDSRHRFGKTTSSDLIPFLESVLGPAEAPDTYSSTDYSKDGEVMTLQNASVGKGINIVFLGDGYTDKDMASGGLYEKLMKEAMEEFFAIEPYKTFRNRFNVYAVKVVSKNGRVGEGYTTALGTYFGSRTFVSGNLGKCYEYALKVPGITERNNLLVTVLFNSLRQSGTTAMTESTQSSVAFAASLGNDRSLFGPSLRHEAGGHGFAFLADEYSVSNTAPSQAYIDERNNKYQKYGWYANIDFTNDPASVKWSAFLSDDRYKDEIGIFEGGSTYAKGVYRPSRNSMMNADLEYFNAPSRWAIYQRIMKLSGETCTFEKFLEYDAVNRGSASAAPRPPLKAAAAPKRNIVHGAPPVVIP